MHDAADNAAVVGSLNTPHIRGQVRLDPLPLLIAQPEQISAHDPDPFQNRIRIVLSERRN
jgi:hypothetical protein